MLRKVQNLFRDANESMYATYTDVRWVIVELMSEEAKQHARSSLIYLLISISCLTAIPFTLKYVYNAYNVNDMATAHWALLATLLVSIGAVEFGTKHDIRREHMWNRNYFTIRTGLISKLFTRSREEVLGENSEFGVEQVESTKDRAQNILYLMFFESPFVIVTILMSTVFLLFVDVTSAAILACLTICNIVWFYLFNTVIDKIMKPIDKKFRSENRRSSERVNMYATVVSHGVEDKMIQEIGEELSEPLNEDLAFWAKKFPKIDIWRRRLNVVVPYGVIALGMTYRDWTIGDLAAVAAWTYAISRDYGYIGHLMRHLTSQATRIRAARETLSTPSVLEDDGDLILERRL